MRPSRPIVGVLVGLCCSLGAAGQERPPHVPEVGAGVIDGRTAVEILPVRFGGDGGTEFLDPSGLEAHLAPRDDPEEELVYPCGSWFQPPIGQYRYWIQGGWRMSPYSLVLGYAGRRGGAGLRAVIPVGGAGRVIVPEAVETQPTDVLELLHAGSYVEGRYPRWEISLRRSVEQLGEGLLLPRGPAIGALWDRKRRRYVALSRPFEVETGKTVPVPLERPRDVAHLLVDIERHTLASTSDEMPVELTLKRKGEEIAPDIEVATADKVYAVWYGLAPGPAELHGESPRAFLDPAPLDLGRGTIERFAGQFRPKATLDVELRLPAPLASRPLKLELRRLPSAELVAQEALTLHTDRRRFEWLPPALLEVTLQTDLGAFSRRVDLSSGKDGLVVFDPEVIVVKGTVYHGGTPRPSKLTFFMVDKTTREVHTNEEGTYEVETLQPLRSVSIAPVDREAAPYVDLFVPAVTRSTDLDFHLPDVEFTVAVVDAVSRKGIPGATVLVRNLYAAEDEGGPADATRKAAERAISQAVSGDDEGLVRLPPLHPGTLEIRASAAGYRRLAQPVRALFDGETDQRLEIPLQRIGQTLDLRLRLPDSAPAAGASVLLMGSLTAASSLFEARADVEGVVSLPREHAGFLLVKHPRAGFLVREWRPVADEESVEWSLPVLAERPLTVRVINASGEAMAPRAELAVWVGGRRLSGASLAWLTGAPPTADANGYWIGTALPRGTVEVLAWTARARDLATTGALDAQATKADFPWPETLEVRAFE